MQYKCECVGAIDYGVALEDRHREKQRKLKKNTQTLGHSLVRAYNTLVCAHYAMFYECLFTFYLASIKSPTLQYFFIFLQRCSWLIGLIILYFHTYVDLKHFLQLSYDICQCLINFGSSHFTL